jgi:hypothetical protein
MTTATLLTPSTDTTPVEKAAVSGIADGFDPETFLWIEFHRPGGGVRIWYAWTAGGTDLGDKIDHAALGNGLDFTDWLHLGDRHCSHSSRGRIKIQAFALRPILGDLLAGERGPQERRDGIARLLATAAAETGRTPRTGICTWLGFGPTHISRSAR